MVDLPKDYLFNGRLGPPGEWWSEIVVVMVTCIKLHPTYSTQYLRIFPAVGWKVFELVGGFSPPHLKIYIYYILKSNWIIPPGIRVKTKNIWNHHLESVDHILLRSFKNGNTLRKPFEVLTCAKIQLHPRKLTNPLKRDYFSMECIFQPLIFRGCSLVFRGGFSITFF